jgi:GNAT superfamily N-acetyltransferase
MTATFEIRPAVPGEGRVVARLIRRSLAPGLRPLTIWGSPRAASYVEAVLALPGSGFYLLSQDTAPAGLAAWRPLAGQAFLNHLYVGPRWRAQGLGRRLLADSLAAHLRGYPADAVALDVLAGNARALSWYQRLGFAPREERSWWLGPRCTPARSPLAVPPRLLAAANRQHRAWGFSTLPLAAGDVGRLYAPYFRLPDPAAAHNVALRAVLGQLDPRRRLLLLAATPQPAPGWRRTAVSRRLTAPVAFVRSRLGPTCYC